MAFGFVKVPALLGIGRYNVTLELPPSGGLYQTSVVTYRGTEIGRVKSVDVTRDGVRAVLKLDSSTSVPADVSAAVHSRSAVGEQFVELTPQREETATHRSRCATVTSSRSARSQIPADIGSLLDATNRRCRRFRRTTCAPSSTKRTRPSAGWGRNCPASSTGRPRWRSRRARPSTRSRQLIDQSPPVLNSQVQTADSIATWAQRTGVDHRSAQGAGRGLRATCSTRAGPRSTKARRCSTGSRPRCRCCWPTW